jgi:ubiquinone/menaquinone biosynthesis C-methylase UbiE
VLFRSFYNISVGAYKGFGGGFQHPCWTNIDLDRPWKDDKYFPGSVEFKPEKDIAHDLLSMTPIPVESSTAELVYSRFAIDRLTNEAAQYFFEEVFRILKKGGVFRIVSTNLDLDYRAYRNNDRDYFFWLGDDFSIEQMFLFHVVSQVSTKYHDKNTENITDEELRELFETQGYEEVLDYCCSKCSVEIQKNNRYDHFNWWNSQKIEKMLKSSGFKTIYRSAAEQSTAPVMRNEYYFDNDHIKVMMYMEAIKN